MQQVKHRAGWSIRAVLAGLALATVPAFAGIRGPTVMVNDLTINSQTFGGGGTWAVSSPTLRSPSGYLSFDSTGKSREVAFRREKGPGIIWLFTDKARFERYEGKGRGLSEEQRGYTMKLRAGEGPLEGWYLGVEDGKLVLVKDARSAATLRMLEKTTEIRSK